MSSLSSQTPITITGTDIGSKNYSWCTITHTPNEHVYHPLFPTVKLPKLVINGWKLLDLKASQPEEVTRNLHAYMVTNDLWRDCLDRSSRVVIEKQLDALMLHSQKMLQISMALLMGILDRNKTVIFESSKRRLTVFSDIIPLLPKQSKSKDAHARNKIISKQLCEMLLIANNIDPAMTEYGKHSKNDDLADSFLLAVVSAWLGTYHADAVEETPVTYKKSSDQFDAESNLKRKRKYKFVTTDINKLGDKPKKSRKNKKQE